MMMSKKMSAVLEVHGIVIHKIHKVNIIYEIVYLRIS